MKRYLLLLFSMLAACQPKSEIDKCVEAQIVQICAKDFPGVMHPERELIKQASKKNEENIYCADIVRKNDEGTFRQDCLRAQAGK